MNTEHSKDVPAISSTFTIKEAWNTDGDNQVIAIDGEFHLIPDGGDTPLLAAKARFFSVRQDKYYINDVLDLDVNTASFMWLFRGDENEGEDKLSESLKKCLYRPLDDCTFIGAFFILDRIEVLPFARGQGIAEQAIQETVRILGQGHDFILLKAYPLQFTQIFTTKDEMDWDSAMRFDLMEKDQKKAMANLHQFYQNMKFLHVGNNYFAKDLNLKWELSVEDLRDG